MNVPHCPILQKVLSVRVLRHVQVLTLSSVNSDFHNLSVRNELLSPVVRVSKDLRVGEIIRLQKKLPSGQL